MFCVVCTFVYEQYLVFGFALICESKFILRLRLLELQDVSLFSRLKLSWYLLVTKYERPNHLTNSSKLLAIFLFLTGK